MHIHKKKTNQQQLIFQFAQIVHIYIVANINSIITQDNKHTLGLLLYSVNL